MIRRIILAGLAGCVWFGALANGAYDPWAACILYAAMVFLVTLAAIQHARRPIPVHIPFLAGLFLLAGVIWLSTLSAFDKDNAFLDAWGWTFTLVGFCLVTHTIEDETDQHFFLSMASLAVLPLCAISLWQQITGRPDSWGRWEIKATLVNSQILAGFALNWFFISWTFARKRLVWAVAASMACVILLLLARSWWAYIALLAGGLVYYQDILRVAVKKRRRLAISIAIAAGLALAAVVVYKIGTHVGPYKGSSRGFYWSAALKIWAMSPWNGVGLSGFAVAFPYVRDPRFQSTLFAHNFPLQWLAETGVAGMTALGLFSFQCWRRLWMRAERPNPAARAIGASLAAVLIYSLMSINLEYPVNKLSLMWILAAALALQPARRIAIKPLWMGLFCVSLWMLSPFWLRIYLGGRSYAGGLQLESAGQLESAERSYQRALVINPYQSQADHALFQLYGRRFLKTGSVDDQRRALRHLQQAIRHKRSLQHVEEFKQLTTRA